MTDHHVAQAVPRRRPDADEATSLLSRFASPLYVYDLQVVDAAYRRFTAAFPYKPTHCHYAIVCNKNPLIVRRLHELGAGVHANTPGDAFCALAAGVPPEAVVYSGTNLTAEDLSFLIEAGVGLNLDSLDQLRYLVSRRVGGQVGLRLLIDDVERGNRIGVAPEELPTAVSIAEAGGVRLVGLHLYAGTNSRRVQRFVDCLDRVATASDLLPDIEYVDLGGGFGISYLATQQPLDLERLGAEVAERMAALSARHGRPLRLLLEPGRILVGEAGTLLVTVVSVKQRGGRRFVGVDSTVGNLVVPSVYHPFHRVEKLGPPEACLATPTDLCGNTTHSRDFLGRDLNLPPLEPGDVLAIRDVGAYGYAMSSHFLNRPRPAEVVLDGDQVHLSTRRETLADLLGNVIEAGSKP